MQPLDSPLTPEEFANLMAGFALSLATPLALAVSGGPDSMALAWGAKAAGYSVRAFIVDHRMRDESSVEAEQTRQRLAAMGIESEIFVSVPP